MTAATPRRPNILWLSLEDTSPRFGCYGDPLARTPHIDRLAAEGRRFPLAFSVAGVCAPSRAAIITGMYPTAIGAHHMRTSHHNAVAPLASPPYSVVPPPYVRTFTEYLRAAGYFCTNNAKTDYQFTPPLTAWDLCGERAHFRRRDADQPFFAVFNFTVTHESGMWPRADRPLRTDPDRVVPPPHLPNTAPVREALARHYDNLEAADARVGEVLSELAADGHAEDTIVFLWSDHGEGLPRGKRWPYDAGIRIPLIVRWPGALPPGSTAEELVSLIDLGPTVLSLTGVPVPLHLQGQPFLGPRARPRTYVYASRDRHDEAYDMVRAVRDRRYKYLRNFFPDRPYLPWIPYRNRHPAMQELWRLEAAGALEGPQRLLLQASRPAEELYDCEADPYELNNLAADPAQEGTLERLRTALDDWRARVGDLGDVPEERMVEQMWPGGVQPQTQPPVFAVLGEGEPGITPSEGGRYRGPVLLQLHCPTQGASIAYRLEGDAPERWRLYSAPLRLPQGETRLVARAVRIGYRDSEERAATFAVEGGA